MAGEVAELCRQYVSDNAETYRDHKEDDAVDALAQGFRRHLVDLGWDDADVDYHINVHDKVRVELLKNRDGC